LIPYAVTWQVKENIRTGSGSIPTDFGRLIKMVEGNGYRGYFPLETFGEGDPFKKVSDLYQKIITGMV
jgi:hypothetical protein